MDPPSDNSSLSDRSCFQVYYLFLPKIQEVPRLCLVLINQKVSRFGSETSTEHNRRNNLYIFILQFRFVFQIKMMTKKFGLCLLTFVAVAVDAQSIVSETTPGNSGERLAVGSRKLGASLYGYTTADEPYISGGSHKPVIDSDDDDDDGYGKGGKKGDYVDAGSGKGGSTVDYGDDDDGYGKGGKKGEYVDAGSGKGGSTIDYGDDDDNGYGKGGKKGDYVDAGSGKGGSTVYYGDDDDDYGK
jgi:hypothetical protein